MTVLLEDMSGQIHVVVEAVGMIQEQMKKLATQEGLDKLTAKVGTIEAAVTATNSDVADHERRITVLEQKT